MVDLDGHCPLSGGISRGRRKKQEKEEEGEPEDLTLLSVDDPDPLAVDLSTRLCRENKLRRSRTQETRAPSRLHREKKCRRGFVGEETPARASRGEGVSSPCVGRRNVSLCGEKV
ncbi:hypothetical protein BHE74_00025401 [Ensete ventricosum]|nr:hypothetical protein BHE74_00025401 [Ensete ventricosum]